MSTVATSHPQTLRYVNEQIERWICYLEEWTGEPCSRDPLAELSELILSASRQLRLNTHDSIPENLKDEVEAYRNHLYRLQAILPQVYQHLLGQRALLEQERAQMQLRIEWIESLRVAR